MTFDPYWFAIGAIAMGVLGNGAYAVVDHLLDRWHTSDESEGT